MGSFWKKKKKKKKKESKNDRIATIWKFWEAKCHVLNIESQSANEWVILGGKLYFPQKFITFDASAARMGPYFNKDAP
jgi:hypothetical protein